MSPNKIFQCRHCKVSFTVKSNCTRHEKRCRTETSDSERFTCNNCSHSFSRKDNLRKHVPKCSGSTVSSRNYVPNKKKTPCLVPNCGLQFQHRTVLIEHLAVAHPSKVAFKPKVSKTFLSDEDFRSWKEEEEESTFSYFVQHSGQHRRIKHFYCQHDGSSKPHSKRKSDAFKSKRIKVGHICIAKMKVSTTESGSVHLEYYPTHSHRLSPQDLVHHPLPHDVNKLINEQISVGVPVDLIYEHAKQMFTLRDTSHVSEMKANMLTRKRIAQRARHKRMSHHLHKNDADAVYLKVKQLIDEEKVVLYKPYHSKVLHDPAAGIDELPESQELFMLGLQTPRQLEQTVA
uniref:C2H2-type domain-containing protein n=1 Tax=Cacopsylla melanoneura TaxID=428564 RepID=A0A8D9BJ78_9HEMI